ncbi:MAG: sulfite exporter TauE/SafE family protein [Saprospiraceae bacterium]|nr:sulfite exporter TauE/SafE family protein [Bacteroidia bacterium]NNL93917.1 sulfite exporter TauE/SafE family protein [Saprospiraceae bacterium]
MYFVAFSLGLLGSLHCIGMCGPLAILFCNKPKATKPQKFFNALNYNVGRTITYTFLGILFASIGSMLVVVDLQKYLSVLIGFILILSFYFTLNLESKARRFKIINNAVNAISNKIYGLVTKAQGKPTLLLGMINGLLPCGLIYLAIAGALSAKTIIEGGLFMTFFGIGTIPALFFLVIGSQTFGQKLRPLFKKVYPLANLFLGVFLIYRGIVVNLPETLNFWEAIKNPIMCH